MLPFIGERKNIAWPRVIRPTLSKKKKGERKYILYQQNRGIQEKTSNILYQNNGGYGKENGGHVLPSLSWYIFSGPKTFQWGGVIQIGS